MSDTEILAPKRGLWFAAVAWLAGRPWKTAVIAGTGATFTVALLAHANGTGLLPLLIAPFGASCALVFGAPASPLAQPKNVVGGHVVSAFCGLLAATLVPDVMSAMALGVGLAIAGMLITETLHPPAGANPIVIGLTHASWSFLFAPVLIGAVIVVFCGICHHRWITRQRYGLGSR